jgi:peptide deformylase
MILPIVAYGDPVLHSEGATIEPNHPQLKALIDNMYETMYDAHGVGLAAPQVGESIKLFIIDASPFEEDEPELKNFKKVFINPVIEEESGEEWSFNEGCLSFPDLRLDINRKEHITIKYQDENFNWRSEKYSGLAARIIQHEYDHVMGVVFIDHITPMRKRMISGRLTNIAKGRVKAEYKMKFFKK